MSTDTGYRWLLARQRAWFDLIDAVEDIPSQSEKVVIYKKFNEYWDSGNPAGFRDWYVEYRKNMKEEKRE